MQNIVINMFEKFHNDRLRNDRELRDVHTAYVGRAGTYDAVRRRTSYDCVCIMYAD